MSFIPSAAAQSIATQAGANQAALATALTALQASIAAGNLAPAAFIDAIVSYLTAPPNWIAPTLLNSWINYAVGTYQSAGYCKDALGWVHLRGLVRAGSSGVIFQLPAGYRPALTTYFPCNMYSGGWIASEGVYIDASGNVTSTGGAANAEVTLNMIHFFPDQ